MDIEYHYYITFIIALRTGFKRDDAYRLSDGLGCDCVGVVMNVRIEITRR
jgi:hypothetical protein